ncbi:UDP-N-acetylmuramate--alanine ligase [Chitinispirillum alkaliphilum]|nr:UDP-N-acetylmuramate--alanine ligase [Chitinispirillum alkaliphilum]
MSTSLNDKHFSKIHFIGILGSGMSAIAQFLNWKGYEVSGSDRQTDSSIDNPNKEKLEAMGCLIYPQNGEGIDESVQAVCVSTAIEETNPDIQKARRLQIPVYHRSDILASIVEKHQTIAVAGTSGKSTVTALIFELLHLCKKSPSLISGASLKRLEEQGYIGNAYKGDSDILVIEADESDGTVVKYKPWISVLLNISKDHKSIEEVTGLLRTLSRQSQFCIANQDDPIVNTLNPTLSFGLDSNAAFHPDTIEQHPFSSVVNCRGNDFHLSLPGMHNISNLLAALCLCFHLNCKAEELQKATKEFKGVERRFSVTKTQSGITVVDDFAHNPEKIKAAVSAAQNISDRLFVLYQPHGFGPTNFLKHDYAQMFKSALTDKDHLLLLPIYYAGGSAVMNIESNDLIKLMEPIRFKASAPVDRESALSYLHKHTKSGDCVLLMGARDPSLAAYAKKITQLVNNKESFNIV